MDEIKLKATSNDQEEFKSQMIEQESIEVIEIEKISQYGEDLKQARNLKDKRVDYDLGSSGQAPVDES